MTDVSTRVLIDLQTFLASRGVADDAIFDKAKFPDLPPEELEPSFLGNPQKRIHWNTYAALFEIRICQKSKL